MLAIEANAQTPCPELERLRNAATEAQQQVTRDPESIRCGSYHRLARAAEAVVEYARNNRESCGISTELLVKMERYHHMAAQDRNNFCAGRLLRPLPLLVIPRRRRD